MASISELIYLIVYVLLAGVLLYVIHSIVRMLELPQPMRSAILVIVALLVLLFILRMLGIV